MDGTTTYLDEFLNSWKTSEWEKLLPPQAVSAKAAPSYPLLPDEGTIKGLTDEEAEAMWRHLRWPGTDGKPTCPTCSSTKVYSCREANGASRWKCKGRHPCFSLTSGTVFAGLKVPIRTILLLLSAVQRNKGDVTISRLSEDIGCNFKTAYILFRKAQEMLCGNLEGKSHFTGYWQGGKAAPDAPRAKLDALLPTKICRDCGQEKPSADFQFRSGAAREWGLTSTVCKACKNGAFSVKMRQSWQGRKETAEAAPIIDRSVADLLAAPRYPYGYLWSTRGWWTPQERHDLTTLAEAGATPDQAAAALGRSATSIAWYARDNVPFVTIPASWRPLFSKPRISVPAQPKILSAYPYLPTLPRFADANGAALTIEVSGLVSRAYPDFMRADVCQIVLLAILEGQTSLDDLKGSPDVLRAFVRSYRKSQDNPYMVGSLDAPKWDNDDTDSYGSTLPAGVLNALEW